jgi:hypothetical protein
MTDRAMMAAAYPSPPSQASPPAHKPSLGSLYERVAMSSSMSPGQYGKQPSDGGYGSPSGGQDKSPLSSLNLGFLKSLTEKRTTRGKHE